MEDDPNRCNVLTATVVHTWKMIPTDAMFLALQLQQLQASNITEDTNTQLCTTRHWTLRSMSCSNIHIGSPTTKMIYAGQHAAAQHQPFH
jgi:hypothetical protein